MSEKLCWKATLCKYLHLKIIKWFLTNQRDVALIVISRVLLIMWFDEILFKQYIILNFKAYLVVFCSLAKVFNSSESKTALFCAKRRQKAPQIFFPKSATILVKGATFWDIWIWKWPTVRFLFLFYVTIFPRGTKNWNFFSKYKIFQDFFL